MVGKGEESAVRQTACEEGVGEEGEISRRKEGEEDGREVRGCKWRGGGGGGGFFFFNDTATTEIYTLSLHDALPI